MTRVMLLIGVLLTGFLALAGCNTIAGAGEDVSAGAHTVQGWFRN